MSKALKRVIGIAIVVAIVVAWVTYKKKQASNTVREQAVVLVRALPSYEENKAFYEAGFDEVHDVAFDQAYNPGGRHRAASFDEEKYHVMLIGLYHRKAVEDGKNQIADALELYRKALGLPAVQFE